RKQERNRKDRKATGDFLDVDDSGVKRAWLRLLSAPGKVIPMYILPFYSYIIIILLDVDKAEALMVLKDMPTLSFVSFSFCCFLAIVSYIIAWAFGAFLN